MTAPLLATSVRKARARSVCALCPRIIYVGNTIGKLERGSWAHVACINAANRQTSTEGKRP